LAGRAFGNASISYLFLPFRAVIWGRRGRRRNDDANAVGIPPLPGRALGDASISYLLLIRRAVIWVHWDHNANALCIALLPGRALRDALPVDPLFILRTNWHAVPIHPLLSCGTWSAHDRDQKLSVLTVLLFLASFPIGFGRCRSNSRSLNGSFSSRLIGVLLISLRLFRRLPVLGLLEDPVDLGLLFRGRLTADY
jgi:hypothetical protein